LLRDEVPSSSRRARNLVVIIEGEFALLSQSHTFLIFADGNSAPELIEEVQQDRNTVDGGLLLSGPARVQNYREALAVRRPVVRVSAAQVWQGLIGPRLGLFDREGIAFGKGRRPP
jgi:hypothetical protein